jgi:hypothetical protein
MPSLFSAGHPVSGPNNTNMLHFYDEGSEKEMRTFRANL